MTRDSLNVLILAGGRGSRLRPVVSDRPKPMALINGRPFLDILISYLGNFGFYRFILCVGYMADFIQGYYAGPNGGKAREIAFSRESSPLGTGGALKNAEALITSASFLVVNGDSFCSVDLRRFIAFHREKESLVSMVVAHAKEEKDFGSVTLDPLNRIVRFQEKDSPASGWINAGIYLFEKGILSRIPPNTGYSLEQDLFPNLGANDFYGFPTTEKLIDFGNPKRFAEAQRVLLL